MYAKKAAIILLLLIARVALGQHQTAVTDSSGTYNSLGSTLHGYGTFEGHFRSYTMATINHARNPDYFAQGVGGGLAYYSPVIKRFQVGLSGFLIYNLHSSSLTNGNGYSNRYELALFDITDPENREDLDRLENLYIRYYIEKSSHASFVQLGKFHLNTPLMNMQDSRMRPNLQEGIWSEVTINKSLQIKGGWLWETSPRSTIRWYGIGESVGLYGNAKAIDGSAAEYYGHVNSRGIGIANIAWTPIKDFTYQVWNYYADNLFNIVLQKAELKKQVNASTLFAGAQHLWQHSTSPDDIAVSSQYIGPEEKSHVVSLRVGISHSPKDIWSINYTRITSHGRFLFPREWGTETLYTYISRERNEGSGDVHAWMIENNRLFGKENNLVLQAMAGIYKMPAVDNFELNKYSMPSYYHLAFKAHYKFHGFFRGLEAQALYVYKGLFARSQFNDAYSHNKVKMHHASLVLNYSF